MGRGKTKRVESLCNADGLSCASLGLKDDARSLSNRFVVRQFASFAKFPSGDCGLVFAWRSRIKLVSKRAGRRRRLEGEGQVAGTIAARPTVRAAAENRI